MNNTHAASYNYPTPKENPQNTNISEFKNKKYKNIAYTASAIALLSFGLSTAIAIKNGKLNKQTDKLSQQMKDALKKAEELSNKLKTQTEKTSKTVKNLEKKEEQYENNIKDMINRKVSDITNKIKTPQTEEIFTTPVELNGKIYNLAKPLNGYGKHTQTIENTLRSESAKRIFGVVDRSKINPADNIMIRIPTSEFTGFTSTGGMSIVPREIVGNLSAMINSKQNVNIVVDTPLYLGPVRENIFYDIVKRKDGFYDYVSSALEKPMAKLEHIDTMEIPIYLENGKIKEKVEVFLAKDNMQVVDYELLIPWLDKDFLNELREAMKKNKKFTLKTNMLNIVYNPKKMKKPLAFVKFDTIF